MPPTHAKKPAAMREKCAHGGPVKCNAGCYSKGGEVDKPARGVHDTKETGVHGTYSVGNSYPGGDKGVSMAGHAARGKHQWANQEHRRVLNEMKADKHDRRNLAKGGVVTETSSSNRRHQKGVHESISRGDAGTSVAGAYVPGHGYGNNLDTAKRIHGEKLHELRSMKGPHGNYAEGGDVEPLDEPMQDDDHEEIESVLAGELLTAMEKKDKKGVVDAIEALVLQCMNKGGM